MKTTISRKRIIIEQAQALTISTGTSPSDRKSESKKTSRPGLSEDESRKDGLLSFGRSRKRGKIIIPSIHQRSC
ncbi:hypothetical protein BFAG_04651 [Bacteroides fragilis 3_1_12]|uniref:Uncharacterized protein n=1 Tax=Bacteroides fragilis 3_1_12 TaxID=457424 RepID=A0ABN0BSQ7_BACFG|nr:hypothetical protein BFAG_04651 [Bacteroides fragilis 3_1_12]